MYVSPNARSEHIFLRRHDAAGRSAWRDWRAKLDAVINGQQRPNAANLAERYSTAGALLLDKGRASDVIKQRGSPAR